MLLGVAICSPYAAVLAAVGSAIGLATGMALGVDGYQLYQGLWGFSPVLTIMAVAGGVFGRKTPGSFCWGCVGAVLTAFLNGTLGSVLGTIGLPAFTLPFCLATLTFLGAD